MPSRRKAKSRRKKEKLNLGNCNVCFAVKDLRKSMAFYRKLDFRLIGGVEREGWVIMAYANLSLGLFEGYIKKNTLNFRGADVSKVARVLQSRGIKFKMAPRRAADGGESALTLDPDGNPIFFDTAPWERLEPA